MRMLQARGDQRLALEAADRVGGRLEQDFESDRPAEARVLGRDDLAHAAARELALGAEVRGRDLGQARRRRRGGGLQRGRAHAHGGTRLVRERRGDRLV
jgi:hypothetical protein